MGEILWPDISWLRSLGFRISGPILAQAIAIIILVAAVNVADMKVVALQQQEQQQWWSRGKSMYIVEIYPTRAH